MGFPLPSRHPQPPRQGLTLIEVLISIFVLAVGLCGVAAMLPLGQKKMLEGIIDQRKSHIAESAFEALRTDGGLNPSRWVDWDASNWDATKASTGSRILCKVTTGMSTTVFSTDAASLIPVPNYYNNCVLEFRRGTLAGIRRTVLTDAYASGIHTFTLVAGNPLPAIPATTPPDTFVLLRVRPFAIDPRLVATYLQSGTFDVPTSGAGGMPRLTLWSPPTPARPSGGAMLPAAAEDLCVADDELSFNTPSGNDDPRQIYYGEPYVDSNHNSVYDSGETYTDTNGNGKWDPSRRKSSGNFSWAATFVPTRAGNSESCRVSIVVFYKRILALPGNFGGPVGLSLDFSSGYGGGGALLYSANSADLEPIRPGRWLMVGSTDKADYRWYRIETASERFQDGTHANAYQRNVTLVGADWNTTASGMTALPVTYYPSVVGVFERTMKLDSLPDRSN